MPRADELVDERRESIGVAFRPTQFEIHVLSIGPTQIARPTIGRNSRVAMFSESFVYRSSMPMTIGNMR